MNIVFRTFHCDTLVLFATAPVIVCVGAIPVVAEPVGSIESLLITRRAHKHGAPALLSRTSLQICDGASGVLTTDLGRIRLQDVADWWNVVIASSDWITANVAIDIGAPPRRAMDVLIIPLGNVAAWAIIGVAFAFFTATFVVVRVGTVPVIAKYVCSVVSQSEIWRAREKSASPLLLSTCLQIFERAR